MTENKKNTPIFGSDFARMDAHVITAEEYDEAPELNDDMLARGTWTRNGLPISPQEGKDAFAKRLRGRPTVANPKKTVAIRLSQDVLAALKAGGKGWQTRVEDILRASLRL